MIYQEDVKSVRVGIGADIETVEIECPVALDAGEVGGADPFDALLDKPWISCVEDGEAVEKIISSLTSKTEIEENIRRQPPRLTLQISTGHVWIPHRFMHSHVFTCFET
jgi:hypothetical protein